MPELTSESEVPKHLSTQRSDYDRTNIDFHQPMPRPNVRGAVIDIHCHLLAAKHADAWFEAADHFGIDLFFSMGPLEEAPAIQKKWGKRVHFTVVPDWIHFFDGWYDDWMRRLEGFHELGSRMVKFHMAPQSMDKRHYRLDSPELKPFFREIEARGMAVMTHVGDPDTWYASKYTDHKRYGTREDHYRMWADALAAHPNTPWIGAHMGGNPENLDRLQHFLDTYPNLVLDCSATRWMVREISARRDSARAFFIRNKDRILFGTDQVSGDDREFGFLASRFWAHRKLWETDVAVPSPIFDPDLPEDRQPILRGLALPADVLQALYHDNAVRFMAQVGVKL